MKAFVKEWPVYFLLRGKDRKSRLWSSRPVPETLNCRLRFRNKPGIDRRERERERENLLAGLAAPVQSTFARLHYNPLHRWVAAVHACFSSTQSPSSACPLPRQKTKSPRSRGSVCGLSSGDVWTSLKRRRLSSICVRVGCEQRNIYMPGIFPN